MRKLLNTLYVTSENAYLALDGETVDVLFEDGTHRAVPLHTLDSIVCFSYKGASPALMGKCAECNVHLSFYTPNGRYLASAVSGTNGNVLLRRKQYRFADDKEAALQAAKNIMSGKLYNSKFMLLRCARDHAMQTDSEKLRRAADNIGKYLKDIGSADSVDSIRGIEGNAAAEYFGVFDEMILRNKEDFRFCGRNRRPPTDNVNAMLSFAYSLLANDCTAALYSAGLDPYVGFVHTDRPGRRSLALDLMEELRSVYADRFVLTLINNRVMSKNDFEHQESGAVRMTDDARRTFLSEWQKRKRDELTHPYLEEKMSRGLVPYIQAMLLARTLRGDLDEYPPFFWK